MKSSAPLVILNVLCALLFAVFAWVQYNDTDPAVYDRPSVLDAWLWLAFYALISVLFVWILFKPVAKWILLAAAIACLVEMGRTAPGLWENLFGEAPFTMTQISMSASDPRVELTREFFGALLALAAVVVLWWEAQRSRARE